MKHRVALLGPSLVAAVATAQVPNIPDSAYRRDLPMVLTPAPASPSPAPQFNREAFAAAYARAGRPAIALLWNREFTDLLQQGMAYQLSIDSVHAAAGSREAVRADGYQAAGAQGAMASSTTVTQREVRSGQGLRSGPAERIDLEMRSGFVQAITGAGVRLVDRNVVMRTTAARRTGSLDSQQVETDALARHAELVMEVLNTRDAHSPTSWATFVSIKRLGDGVVLAEGYMNGRPPQDSAAPPWRFEADPDGGFREVRRSASPGDAGRLAGELTLARLTGAL
jgi:hypothetical protein